MEWPRSDLRKDIFVWGFMRDIINCHSLVLFLICSVVVIVDDAVVCSKILRNITAINR